MAHRVSSHRFLPADVSYLALRYQGVTSWLRDRWPWASLGFLQWIFICWPSRSTVLRTLGAERAGTRHRWPNITPGECKKEKEVSKPRETLPRGVVTIGIIHRPGSGNQGGRLAQATKPIYVRNAAVRLGNHSRRFDAWMDSDDCGYRFSGLFLMAAYWDFPDDWGRIRSGKSGPCHEHRNISPIPRAPGYSVDLLGGNFEANRSAAQHCEAKCALRGATVEMHNIPLANLALSPRTFNALWRGNITEVAQVLTMSDKELTGDTQFWRKVPDRVGSEAFRK